jgi:hypothetical protein
MKVCAYSDSTQIDRHKRLVQIISEESKRIDSQKKQNSKREEILTFLIELQCRTCMNLK